MILLIDNYDSFTYNLYHSLNRGERKIRVVRNDEITIEEIRNLRPGAIVISPGPKSPGEAGICLEVIKTFYDSIPILGVCLGHQAMGEAFGGRVVKAREMMHGKTSQINHDGRGIFRGVSRDVLVARYHSLAIDDLPEELIVTATAPDGEVMAICHRDHPLVGVQFHPESLFTQEGDIMIDNFFKEVAHYGI